MLRKAWNEGNSEENQDVNPSQFAAANLFVAANSNQKQPSFPHQIHGSESFRGREFRQTLRIFKALFCRFGASLLEPLHQEHEK
jgi:hypothetical protein